MILLTGEIKSAQIKKQPVRERESSFTPNVIQMLPAVSQGHALSFKECLTPQTKKLRFA